MTQSPTNPFLTRYPGPYAIRPSTEGVDLTFDVFCRTTDKLIIAARYWEAEEDARRVASVIALALELARRGDFTVSIDRSLQRKLQEFRDENSGRYVVSEFSHYPGIAEIGIANSEDDSTIICTTATPGDPELTQEATYIAEVLNQLFDAREM